MLNASGLDIITATSAAATALANVGPGMGDIIGPVGNFKSLTDLQKWILTVAMLIGRLELLTVLVLILPRFWRV
jgi:trk system potassium uptake protein TrkH